MDEDEINNISVESLIKEVKEGNFDNIKEKLQKLYDEFKNINESKPTTEEEKKQDNKENNAAKKKYDEIIKELKEYFKVDDLIVDKNGHYNFDDKLNDESEINKKLNLLKKFIENNKESDFKDEGNYKGLINEEKELEKKLIKFITETYKYLILEDNHNDGGVKTTKKVIFNFFEHNINNDVNLNDEQYTYIINNAKRLNFLFEDFNKKTEKYDYDELDKNYLIVTNLFTRELKRIEEEIRKKYNNQKVPIFLKNIFKKMSEHINDFIIKKYLIGEEKNLEGLTSKILQEELKEFKNLFNKINNLLIKNFNQLKTEENLNIKNEIIKLIKQGVIGVNVTKIQEDYNKGIELIQKKLLELYEKLKNSKDEKDFPRSEKKLNFSKNSKEIFELLTFPQEKFQDNEFKQIREKGVSRQKAIEYLNYWNEKMNKFTERIQNSKTYAIKIKEEIELFLKGIEEETDVFQKLTIINGELLKYMKDNKEKQGLINELNNLKQELNQAEQINQIELNQKSEVKTDNVNDKKESDKEEKEISEAEQKTKEFNQIVKKYIEQLDRLIIINQENNNKRLLEEFKVYEEINKILKELNKLDDSLIKEKKEAVVAEQEKMNKFIDDYGNNEIKQIIEEQEKINKLKQLGELFKKAKEQNENILKQLEEMLNDQNKEKIVKNFFIDEIKGFEPIDVGVIRV